MIEYYNVIQSKQKPEIAPNAFSAFYFVVPIKSDRLMRKLFSLINYKVNYIFVVWRLMVRYRIVFLFPCVFNFFVSPAFSQVFKQINIVVEQDSIDELETHPFTNEDVHGDFDIEGEIFNNVELHYRGAYYLRWLMNHGSKRNWKVKFSKSNKFEGRREWNFNYENYIRQNLAYQVFKEAGVPVVSAENVILSVNGVKQGLYLKYEDPDDKDWLKEVFGDNDGDLYKAAYDMPNEEKYFADLSYLGPNDSNYFLHYRKQTNKKGDDEFNYSSIREFTELINHTPKDAFEEVIQKNFDVEEFIDYLVVSNFISNWDSYPYRPKNYFLYDNPEDSLWHYIPWDLDGTFQDYGNRNPLRTTGSIFHYFDGVEPYNNTPTEPLERPLVWNLMEVDRFRDKYCFEYHQAIETFLRADHLVGIIDSIAEAVALNTNGQELIDFNIDVSKTKEFIFERIQNVKVELGQCIVEEDPFITSSEFIPQVSHRLVVYPNPSSESLNLVLPDHVTEEIRVIVINSKGELCKYIKMQNPFSDSFSININDLDAGLYFIKVRSKSNTSERKIIKE